MDEQTQKSPPLWKQLIGAGIGSLIALTIYGGYKLTSTHLGAYLTIPWVSPLEAPSGEVEVMDASENAQKRLAARAKQIAEEFSTRKVHMADDTMYEEEVAPVAPIVPLGEAEEPEPMMESTPEPEPEPAPEPEHVTEEEIQPVEEALKDVEPPALPSSGIGLPLVTVFAFLGAIAYRYRKVLEQPLW